MNAQGQGDIQNCKERLLREALILKSDVFHFKPVFQMLKRSTKDMLILGETSIP
jgi:hypothetical protein